MKNVKKYFPIVLIAGSLFSLNGCATLHSTTIDQDKLKFVTTSSGLKISIRHDSIAKDSVVIIAPGFYNNKDTPTFKRLYQDLEPSFDVISMDFRGHGQSEGEYTFSAKEKEDLKAVLDYAKIYYKKIGLIGFSYGGSIAIIEDAQYQNINSLVCVGSPMASDQIENRWWTVKSMKFGIENFEFGKGVRLGNPFLKKTKAIDAVSQIANTPILFIHGDQDQTVDKKHSLMLYEEAKGLKEIKIFKDAGHAEEVYKKYPKEFIQIINQWFEKTLI